MSPTSTMATSPRELFGGAITALMPQGLIDAADLRQVPDNQEVLLSPTSNLTHIVEILEAVETDKDDEAAARFHFSSLAHDNEAQASRVTSVVQSPSPSSSSDTTPGPTTLTGLQTIRKFNSATANSPLDLVLIHVAVWRLSPRKNIDVVMSWNEPVVEGDKDKGQTAEEVQEIQRKFDGGDDSTGASLGSPLVREAFQRAVESFTIRDWSLFA